VRNKRGSCRLTSNLHIKASSQRWDKRGIRSIVVHICKLEFWAWRLVLVVFLLLFSRHRAGAIPEPAFPLLANAIFSEAASRDLRFPLPHSRFCVNADRLFRFNRSSTYRYRTSTQKRKMISRDPEEPLHGRILPTFMRIKATMRSSELINPRI